MAKKSYSTGKVLFYPHRFLLVCQFVVFWFVSDSWCDISLRHSLQIKLVFQNCIILFTSLKVQRSTLLLNSSHLMLNLKNKIGMAEVNRDGTEIRKGGRREREREKERRTEKGGEKERRTEGRKEGGRKGQREDERLRILVFPLRFMA